MCDPFPKETVEKGPDDIDIETNDEYIYDSSLYK